MDSGCTPATAVLWCVIFTKPPEIWRETGKIPEVGWYVAQLILPMTAALSHTGLTPAFGDLATHLDLRDELLHVYGQARLSRSAVGSEGTFGLDFSDWTTR